MIFGYLKQRQRLKAEKLSKLNAGPHFQQRVRSSDMLRDILIDNKLSVQLYYTLHCIILTFYAGIL